MFFAILSSEPEAHELTEAVARAGKVLISAATLLECAIVIESRWGGAAGRIQSEEPLLLKGEDFSKTDIAPAIE